MKRIQSVSVYVEGRVRPKVSRTDISLVSRLVALIVAVAAITVWWLILRLELKVTSVVPVLAALDIWLVCTVIASYVFNDFWKGTRDRVSIDVQRTEAPGGGLLFRAKVPLGRVLLLWGAVTGLAWGLLLVIIGATEYAAMVDGYNSEHTYEAERWVRIGAITVLVGTVFAGLWLVLRAVPPGLAFSREGLSFRRGFGEERRGWGEIRSVAWGGGAGIFAWLQIDFYEDRPLRRLSVGIGSNVELVGRLIEFYRMNPKKRGSLNNLDSAIDTFEMHH